MAEPELEFPSLLADLSELSLVPMELLDLGPGNLLADEQFEFGLQVQMEDGLAKDDAMVTPLFGDLGDWVQGLCNPSHLLPDTNLHHHQLEDKSYSIIVDQATTSKQTHSNHELDMVPMRGSWGGCGQRKHRKKSTSWKLEDKSYSIIVDQATTSKQTHSNHELDMVPMRGSWGGCGQRKHRKKSTSWKAAETNHLSSFLKLFASGDVNFGTRKNYSHWTSHEVEKLLNGVDEHGVGNWAKIKKTYFKTSPRTAEHLKDKWRGLCRACGIQVGSKQKVKAQPATREILKGFTKKIRDMARKHDAY